MMKLLCFLIVTYLAAVKSNDIRLGYVQPQSKIIYSEIKEASPALWKRTDDVTVNVTGHELINAVYVTDLRDDKDGEAEIVSGGVGLKSVTIALKSPSVLRGYKFHIEVYGNDPNARFYSKGGNQQYSDDVQYARKF